jgi:flagellar hook-associated protein 2
MGSISSGTINNYGNVLLPAGSQAINVQSLLNSAISAAQAPLNLVQALTNTSGAINAVTATSSNTSVLGATADATALPGTHSVVVNSLATTASYYSSAVASGTTTLAAGSFQITVGSNAPVTVTVGSSNNTLNTLAASINAQNIGVTASVITDANGARLALVSNTSGANGNFTISNNSTTLSFTQAASGANGSLTVDGVPVSSTSNTVTGAIPGVTLNLAGAAPAQTVTLTLAPDASQASTAINAFVSAWNKVIGDINAQFNVSSNGTGGGPLETDNNLRNIQDQLLSAVTYAISGNNGLVNLASIGVNMNTDGTLSVDSGTLTNALSGNYAAVQNLLQGTSGVGSFLSNALSQITDPTQGSITLDLQGLSQTSSDLGTQISTMQAQLATQTQALTQQYAQMQTTLDEMPQLQNEINAQLTGLSNG